MGKIIACVNEKGGVAKTTTVKNLSVGLAGKGKRVLAVDLDPSANLTKALGMEIPNDGEGEICHIFDKMIECEEIPAGYGILPQEEGIDAITSSSHLHAVESRLETAMQREVMLRNYLNPLKGEYDYIFLDCPAGLGIFVVNALFSADALIIPLPAQFLAVEAVQNLFRMVSMVRKMNGTNRKPEILGILFTMVRTSTCNDKRIMEEIRSSYGSGVRIFQTYITLAAKIPESDLARKSIFAHANSSSAAMIYNDLVEEVLSLEDMG